MSVDLKLRQRAERVIPGGMYGHLSVQKLPAGYPQFFESGEGAYLRDVDGRRYLDFMCAYGPNLFGYGDHRVEAAAERQRVLGDALTGPAPVMVELAEALVSMVTHADWAIFCKNGTDATTAAMTVARAQTRRRKVLVASGAYHGAAPWCTPMPAGTLPEDRAHIIQYAYNDVASLEAAVAEAGDDLAAVYASPFKHDAFIDQELPDSSYAQRCRQLCDEKGALLVVDDVRAGFRLVRDCSWAVVGVEPDLSCWGKSIANGYPISALLGSDSCRQGASEIYITGSFWFAAVAMAAGLETARIIRDTDYLERTVACGEQLRAGLDASAQRQGFRLRQTGPVQMPQILFHDDPDYRVGFAFCAAMLERGIYMHPWHNMFLCSAMTQDDMVAAIAAADGAMADVRARHTDLQPHADVVKMLGKMNAQEGEASG